MGVSSFIAVDPITALHMGLSRDAAVIERARKHADILEDLLTSSGDPQRPSGDPPIHGDSPIALSLPESRVSAALKSHAKRIRPSAVKREPLPSTQPQLTTLAASSPITSLPSLEQIFLGKDRLSGPYIRSLEESVRIMGRIAAAGFDTADDFRSFLQFISQGDSARYHQVCSLVEMGVTVGHAHKVVLLFDSLYCWKEDASC